MPFLVEWNTFGPILEFPHAVSGSCELPDWRLFAGRLVAELLRIVTGELGEMPFEEPGITIEVQVTRVATPDLMTLFQAEPDDSDVEVWPDDRWTVRRNGQSKGGA